MSVTASTHALVLGGAVTMTIGWAVAAVGAIALVDGDDRAE